MTGRLQDKVALITGGGTGSGKAAAIVFAEEGAKIVIASRRPPEAEAVVNQIRAKGGTAIYVKTDIARSDDCREVVARTVKEFGRLDIAMNNAGIPQLGTNIADLDEAEFEKVIAINLTGIFFCMKYEIQAMLKSGSGSIINISSVAGQMAGPGGSAYSASKHGVIGLTKAAAMETATKNIRVNALLPGSFASELFDKYLDAGMEATILAAHPMGRFAEPEEVARAALFLASSDSSFVTGVSLPVDGGFLVP